MSCSLPPEILDLIVGYLCDYPAALKTCCLVSKPWVPRTRKYLFAHVDFDAGRFTIRSWVKAFPDLSNSPGHHTRDLRIYGPLPEENAWIHSFHNVEKLSVYALAWGTRETSLVVLHGLSPTLKSFYLIHSSIPSSKIFNLICSFPLLEDLMIRRKEAESKSNGWVAPSTSPKLTGALYLIEEIRSTVLPLLALPDGLHFTKIMLTCTVGDAGLVMDLVSRCSETLEFLCIDYRPSSTFPSPLEVCSTLTFGSLASLETPPPLDLSQVARLQDVEICFAQSSVQWIVTTLRTANTKHLRQITIFPSVSLNKVQEVDLRGWQSLDHLLVQLWTSHSIIPKIKTKYTKTPERVDVGEVAPTLFPELVKRGVTCEA